MKLILKQSVESLGVPGDVVSVKAGYGRNYLIPQGLAYAASAANVKRLEEEQKLAEERQKRDYLEARRRASQLSGLSLTFRAKAGEEGKLFGSVTNADIADRANEGELDFKVDRKTVLIEEPLRSLGVFQVAVKLHTDVQAEIEVKIEREEG